MKIRLLKYLNWEIESDTGVKKAPVLKVKEQNMGTGMNEQIGV